MANLRYEPANWELIPSGLEGEVNSALNAVSDKDIVTLDPFYEEILVSGRISGSINRLVQYVGVNYTLDLLAAFGKAVTVNRIQEGD